MPFKLNISDIQTQLLKSVSDEPANALVRPPWATPQVSSAFGSTEVFFIATKDGTIEGMCNIRTETPGEVNIVIREEDLAIAFVKKYRNQVLPNTPENIEWRNNGNLDLLTAPNLGMDTLELTRGWTFNPEAKGPWKVMTEGEQETGKVVERVTTIGLIYPNTGNCSTWADVSFGFATDHPYGGTVDALEKTEIKKVYWLQPEEVQNYVLTATCGFSLAAMKLFEAYCFASNDPRLRELACRLTIKSDLVHRFMALEAVVNRKALEGALQIFENLPMSNT